jgi:hypothetical protein
VWAGFDKLSVGIKDIGKPAPTKSTAIAALEPFASRVRSTQAIGLLLFDHQNICVYPHLRLGAFICGFKKNKMVGAVPISLTTTDKS